MHDPVNSPSHYADGSIECIEALEASTTYEGFCAHLKLTAIAYLWRYEKKNGLEDLKKAEWYINRLISTVEAHQQDDGCANGFCPMPGIRHDPPIEQPISFDPV